MKGGGDDGSGMEWWGVMGVVVCGWAKVICGECCWLGVVVHGWSFMGGEMSSMGGR